MNKRAWKDWATLCRRDPCPSPRVQSDDLGQCVATCLVLVSLLCRCSSGLLLLWSWQTLMGTNMTNSKLTGPTHKRTPLQQLLSQGLPGCRISCWPGPACNVHPSQGSGALALLHPETSGHIQKAR